MPQIQYNIIEEEGNLQLDIIKFLYNNLHKAESVIRNSTEMAQFYFDSHEAYLMFAPLNLTCDFLTYHIAGLNNQFITDSGN